MINFLKILSKILIIPCPFSGMFIIAFIMVSFEQSNYYWLLVFPILGYVIVSLGFFFKMHDRDKWADSWKLCKTNAIGVFEK